MLHVQGARLVCHADPASADAALELAEKLGRASLDDLRRTVRLLSDTTDPDLGTPVELTDDLKRLAESFAAAGITVHLHAVGALHNVRPVVSQAIYRIVQEAITNAVRHAPASTIDVAVEATPHRISIRVENAGGDYKPARSGTGSGQGLRNMLERAAVLGGGLEAGPTKSGWRVTAWVPVAPSGEFDDA